MDILGSYNFEVRPEGNQRGLDINGNGRNIQPMSFNLDQSWLHITVFN